MARKRYSAEQIIGHLRQGEILISGGKTIGEAARQLSISEQTSYRCAVNTAAWKSIKPGA